MFQKLPQPSPNHVACSKCQGTGKYCMGIHNGKPYSHTGFTCYTCGGAGWFAAKPKAVEAPKPAEVYPTPIRYRTQAEAKRCIQLAIDTNDAAVTKALLLVYRGQTEAEKNSDATVEDNGIGFGAFDAEILTSFAKQLIAGRGLSAKQLDIARKKVRRYWKQLMKMSAAAYDALDTSMEKAA